MARITPKTVQEFLADAISVVTAESGVPLDTRQGAVIKAILLASAVNQHFIQGQVIQVDMAGRLQDAGDADVDSFVAQFVPPFTPRVTATYNTSGPVSPEVLQNSPTTNYLRVDTISGLLVGQALTLAANGKTATTTITTIQPTTMLTTAVAGGAVTLQLTTTAGMFVGGQLTLVDGIYSATCTIQSVDSGTQVTVTALYSAIAHTYATATTVVQLINVLYTAALTLNSGAQLTDFPSGTMVTATTMLNGVYFFRNNADATTPSIPVGYVLQAKGTTMQYAVIGDTTNAQFDSVNQQYTIPANEVGVYVSVQCLTPGTVGAVIAQTLTVLTQPLTGIDGATNYYPINNAQDTETTPALITRFQDFVAGLGGGTADALIAKIQEIQPNLQLALLENVAADGVTLANGNFVVVVGDANGNLGTNLYNAVYAVVDANRPFTARFTIVPPTQVVPSIAMTLVMSLPTGINASDVRTSVQNAIYASFSGRAAGGKLVFNELIYLALSQSYVTDVTQLTVNGNGFDRTSGSYVVVGTGPADVQAGALELLRPPLANIVIS